MQRLEYFEDVDIAVEQLRSKDIVKQFEQRFSSSNTANFVTILPLLLESKSNFDRLVESDRFKKIFTVQGFLELYQSKNLSEITNLLITNSQIHQLIKYPIVLDLYFLHKNLLNAQRTKSILLPTEVESEPGENINDGIIIFTVVNEDNITLEELFKIVKNLNELFIKLSNLVGGEISEPEIVLLDSGSDINLGIQDKAETAKSLFHIFKEIWEFFRDRKAYNENKDFDRLMKSLSYRELIKEKLDNGVITSDEAKEYDHYLKTRTEKLIGLNVLPREIVSEEKLQSNRSILIEQNPVKMIENTGNNNQEEE
ncbi:hypothetical protein [Lewinella sp. IMCC34191]|uniref:hypothetical protein n=1 Tax=Lewinella sp. IMCC34191 TaxID=2259172 RepID=UPI000E24A7DE|nr:hypothetical protein [Lewinella sp. IMCC34191]